MKHWPVAVLVLFGMLAQAQPLRAQEADFSLEDVNDVAFSEPSPGKVSPVVLKAQVLLDRSRFSPGVIDGLQGENFSKAVQEFERAHDLEPDGKLDEEVWARLTEASRDPVLIAYTISEADLKGPFVKSIPDQFEQKANLDRLSYTSPAELLAEKFHMDQDLLESLNRGKRFDRAGTSITVANVRLRKEESEEPLEKKAEGGKIEVDKDASMVRLRDKSGTVLATYPASVGSEEQPAPSGTFKVKAIVQNPVYTYNPEYEFAGVSAKEPFDIQPGPNNPVGTIWIDLSAESYGIHGTPEPAQIGKVTSHGCVRLTNWDAEELASMAEEGMPVEFLN